MPRQHVRQSEDHLQSAAAVGAGDRARRVQHRAGDRGTLPGATRLQAAARRRVSGLERGVRTLRISFILLCTRREHGKFPNRFKTYLLFIHSHFIVISDKCVQRRRKGKLNGCFSNFLFTFCCCVLFEKSHWDLQLSLVRFLSRDPPVYLSDSALCRDSVSCPTDECASASCMAICFRCYFCNQSGNLMDMMETGPGDVSKTARRFPAVATVCIFITVCLRAAQPCSWISTVMQAFTPT